MSQQEILYCLKKSGRPLAAQEIAEEIGLGIVNVCSALRKLIKFNEVYYIEIDRFKAMELYNSKRRMKLYLVI